MPNSISQLENSLYQEFCGWTLIDPHSHINPHSPKSQTLADILGYHYFTELAHAAGMPRERIEEQGIQPREKVARLFEFMPRISNTIQWSWFEEISTELIGVPCSVGPNSNWEVVYDAAEKLMSQDSWENDVLEKSRLSAVFLTNDFDDPLQGFDTSRYIPCLRTDDLVFHFSNPAARERLEKATNIAPTDIAKVRRAIGQLFTHFIQHNAKACAISLPPSFAPTHVGDADAETALQAILKNQQTSTASEVHRVTLSQWMFWTLAENCNEFKLPFDLMIGVVRKVYPAGVFQGQDLYDSRVSLIQYAELFNAFPSVTFPISVLASVTNQELVDYSWIFPNVQTHGHWWYSNTPSFIERDLAARLEAIPRNKILGYYSDMYKLEFALPKFNMFRRILARVLARDFVIARNWTESAAIDLARDVLINNVSQTFQMDCSLT